MREQILTKQNDSLRARISVLDRIIQKHNIDFSKYLDRQKDLDSQYSIANQKYIDNAVEKQELKDKANNMALSLQIGYNPFTGKPYIGGGLSIDVFRFGSFKL